MKLAYSFVFFLLCASSVSGQTSTEDRIKVLKSHNWRISTVAIKYRDSTEFKWLKPYDVEPCFYEAVFNFNSKFNLLQDFAKECTLDEQGFAKWKFDEKGRLVLYDTGDYLDYV